MLKSVSIMCGIVGRVNFNKIPVSESDLSRMKKAIWYRGPDDEGFYINKDRTVGLANRRLAIIDLSKKGHMPMGYGTLRGLPFKGNRYWITYNGEVYNFKEERGELEKTGYKFKSNTDTEVILALYDKYGVNCLKHLRGMFAFAIYDELKRTLFLARDRIGKKPLKYFFDAGVFIFASELKAILTQKEVHAAFDFLAIHNYLTFGYVPSPSTGFENIQKLEPGHYLLLDLETKKLIKIKYWEPDFSEKLQMSEGEWCKKILETLEESTKLRMLADVCVGAFLSGGVDSSAVVAMMARNSARPVKTFTIGFNEKHYNEVPYAERVAKLYHTDHTNLNAAPESVEILPELVRLYEEPYADASAVVTYMISKLARKYVKVILNGDGGDENFAGYDRYTRIKRDILLDNFEWLIRPLGIPVSSFLSERMGSSFWQRINKFFKKSRLPLSHRFVTYSCFFKKEDKGELYNRKFNNLLETNQNETLGAGIIHPPGGLTWDSYEFMQQRFQRAHVSNEKDRSLFADLTMYLPDDLLVKVDIATMATSLESRSPLLDQNIVELAAKIPFDLKINDKGENKYIFKKALEKIVPRHNLYRPKKGFSIPLSKWFTGSLKAYTKSILLSRKAKTRNIFNQNYIAGMLKSHTESTDFGPRLWSLLTLELWFNEYFD